MINNILNYKCMNVLQKEKTKSITAEKMFDVLHLKTLPAQVISQ